MATDAQTASGIISKFAAADVSARKMFGEYGLYKEGKMFACICDGILYIKPTQSALSMLCKAPLAPPYPGAKPMVVVQELSNEKLLCALAAAVASELPQPKRRK